MSHAAAHQNPGEQPFRVEPRRHGGAFGERRAGATLENGHTRMGEITWDLSRWWPVIPNKTIAHDLGISPVEIYRANLMADMKAGSLSELIRMVLVAAQRLDCNISNRGSPDGASMLFFGAALRSAFDRTAEPADVTMPADNAAPFRDRPSQACLVAAMDAFDRADIRPGHSEVTHGVAQRHRPGRVADETPTVTAPASKPATPASEHI